MPRLKIAIALVSLVGGIPSQGAAQALGVQVRDGDVYVQYFQAWERLTRDGRAITATTSRDGSLVAYVRNEGGGPSDEMNSISLCVVATRSCRTVVSPESADEPTKDLTGAAAPMFSYQAKAEADGRVIGSLFFMTNGWATSGAIDRVTLGPNPAITFVTDSNSLGMVQSGKFAGALYVSQHIYAPQGGSCDQQRIFDPNTKKVLQNIPTPECQELHIQ